jgi:hypothetical protein
LACRADSAESRTGSANFAETESCERRSGVGVAATDNFTGRAVEASPSSAFYPRRCVSATAFNSASTSICRALAVRSPSRRPDWAILAVDTAASASACRRRFSARAVAFSSQCASPRRPRGPFVRSSMVRLQISILRRTRAAPHALRVDECPRQLVTYALANDPLRIRPRLPQFGHWLRIRVLASASISFCCPARRRKRSASAAATTRMAEAAAASVMRISSAAADAARTAVASESSRLLLRTASCSSPAVHRSNSGSATSVTHHSCSGHLISTSACRIA